MSRHVIRIAPPVAGLLLALLGGAVMAATPVVRSPIGPAELHCEYLQNPLGIDAPRPRLGWSLGGSRQDGVAAPGEPRTGAAARDEGQSAYQILVASSIDRLKKNRGDLWNSGRVASGEQFGVEYAGKPLVSGQQVFWKVRTWDRRGAASDYSAPGRWEMALLSPRDWKAKWISHPRPLPATEKEQFGDLPAPLFRKELAVRGKLKRARAYATGLGYYELRINGRKVGDHVLDPGWTTYSRRVFYSTYDVTPFLQPGANAVGMMAGNGWYNPLPLPLFGRFKLPDALPVGKPRVLLQIELEYESGRRETLATDETWLAGDGPILRNSVFLGETYDARLEQPGWDRVTQGRSPDAARWLPAVVNTDPVGPLQAQFQPPIRAVGALRPSRSNITEPKPGVHIVDLTRNFAGRIVLEVTGKAGTRVRLRQGELLYKDGTLNPMTSVMTQLKNSRVSIAMGGPPTAWQEDAYVLRGEGKETFRPRFTFHGFRYVEVVFEGEAPASWYVFGEPLHSDVRGAGDFECSNELFNRIHEMVCRTQLSNMFSVQSDCPHREKLGYGGDIVAASEMAMLTLDMNRFYAKTVRDFADARRPNGGLTETAPYVGIADEGLGGGAGPVGWGTAHPLLLWQLHQYYGDRHLLAEQYDVAKDWLALLERTAKDGILDNGISDHESLVPKPRALTGTAFYYYNAHLLSRIAKALGKQEDASRYARLAQSIREAFNRRFLQPGTGKYDTGSQACQSFALYMGLVPDSEREKALQVLVDDVMITHKGHLTTGIFGTKYLLDVLSSHGRADVAYTIANQRDFPGWGHMLANGATTLWEHWAFSDNTYSHNHPMFGSISEWFVKSVAGIQPDPDAVGFDRVIIRPQPVGDLTHAEGSYRSIRGRIECAWRKRAGRLTVEVRVPPNTVATVYVPAARAADVSEGRGPAAAASQVKLLRMEKGAAVFRVGSGHYVFGAPL